MGVAGPEADARGTGTAGILLPYDPVRQVAVTPDGQLWITSADAATWSSVAELDGDEGRSETYGWDDGKDVTESW